MLLLVAALLCFAEPPTSSDLLKEATSAWAAKDLARALDLASQAISVDPKNASAYAFRAALRDAKGEYGDGITDWTKAIALDPTDADAYQARGLLNFKAGRIADSIADFDQYIKLRPDQQKRHWQRGISYYYAGQYDDGKRQFESYQDFDKADIENALWRFMCIARQDGVKKAQAAMLKIGDDRRVPMRDIYELYLGNKTPADVLAAANKGEGAAKNRQLFYAHLYLGIWYDLLGQPAPALDHLNKAVDDHRIGHYMWDVARVQRAKVKRKVKSDE